MLVVVTCVIIAIILSYLDSKGIIDYGMKLSFIITGFLLAIHYDYGNDYMPYYHMYLDIWQNYYSISYVINDLIIRNNEYGWTLISLFFSNFGENGFYLMVAVLTSFQTWVYYYTITKYVPRNWWWFATFIYLTDTSLYILEFSMMRQSLAIAVFLLLFEWILKRKILKTLIVIYFLTTIHSSAIVLFPTAFFGYLPIKGGKVYAWIVIILFAACFISKTFLTSIFQYMSSIEQVERYYDSYLGSEQLNKFGLGFIVLLIPFALCMGYLFIKKDISQKALISILIACLSYIIIPFGQIVQLISRIGFYFTAYSVIALPIAYGSIQDQLIKYGLVVIECSILMYIFITFFNNPIWIEHYSNFDTIFSVL